MVGWCLCCRFSSVYLSGVCILLQFVCLLFVVSLQCGLSVWCLWCHFSVGCLSGACGVASAWLVPLVLLQHGLSVWCCGVASVQFVHKVFVVLLQCSFSLWFLWCHFSVVCLSGVCGVTSVWFVCLVLVVSLQHSLFLWCCFSMVCPPGAVVLLQCGLSIRCLWCCFSAVCPSGVCGVASVWFVCLGCVVSFQCGLSIWYLW